MIYEVASFVVNGIGYLALFAGIYLAYLMAKNPSEWFK